jgi:hypothetical protein
MGGGEWTWRNAELGEDAGSVAEERGDGKEYILHSTQGISVDIIPLMEYLVP